MAAFALYLVLFLAGIAWGLAAGFGEALFAPESPATLPHAPGSPRHTFLAALATGFGGSGALLTRAARWSGGMNFGLALAAGLLFAALVTMVTGIVLNEERRPTSP